MYNENFNTVNVLKHDLQLGVYFLKQVTQAIERYMSVHIMLLMLCLDLTDNYAVIAELIRSVFVVMSPVYCFYTIIHLPNTF